MLLSGAEIIVQCLLEQGVDTVFGYPGGTVLCVYDALYRHRDSIRHILTAHEQGAAHAADGYARATGRTGVCMVTSGPGATNLVTGIATAYMDSTPLVAITVNVSTGALGKDSFQEVDIAGITMPVTKHNFIVKDVDKLADTLRRAFAIAGRGRKGPVLVDITKDVTQYKTEFSWREKAEAAEPQRIDEKLVKQAAKLLRKAKKPTVLIGGGAVASKASAALSEFSGLYRPALVETMMGRTEMDFGAENFFGMVGIHGSKTANKALYEADLILTLGCRFSDRVTANPRSFAKNARIVQIDIDEAELGKNVPVELAICGDIRQFLVQLNEELQKEAAGKTGEKTSKVGHRGWLEYLKKEFAVETGQAEASTETNDESSLFTPENIVKRISDIAPSDAIVVTEVGQNQMWAVRNYRFTHRNRLVTSGGLGTMGFGLGAAIGAKLGCPDRFVINFAGDGCFRMNMNELSTASAHGVHFVEILFKNNTLGMVRQWQELFYGERYSATDLADNIDYVMLAKALGARAAEVYSLDELESVLKEEIAISENRDAGDAKRGPLLLVCDISKEELVWPMVIPGSSIERSFMKDDFLK